MQKDEAVALFEVAKAIGSIESQMVYFTAALENIATAISEQELSEPNNPSA
jgi:hypothetical protein